MNKALHYETLMWTSLFRWIRRRPAAPGSEVATFQRGASVVPLIWAFIVLSAIELVAVDLVLHRWTVARVTADVLGVYGLIWMFGMLAIVRVHPHAVTTDELLLRSGPFVEIRVPRDQIESVRPHRRFYTTSTKVQIADGTASLVGNSQTQIDIRLLTPMAVADSQVTEIRIAVDDPTGFVAALELRPAARITQ